MKKNILLFLVLAQILLLLNMSVADSYVISQSIKVDDTTNINRDFNSNKLLLFIGKVFTSLVTIKQIATISAQDLNQANLNCCLATNSGATCQDTVSELISSTDPNSCASPLPTRCSEISSCKLGTCVYNGGETCSANVPMQLCQSNNGSWTDSGISNVPECLKGLCVLGNGARLTTSKQCEILSGSLGLKYDFRQGLTEADLVNISADLTKGACLTPNGNCRFVTSSECVLTNGNFYQGVLCTNPDLATNCKQSLQTKCANGNVYFIDTCGNLANIYDSSKVNDTDYWNFYSEDICTINPGNPSSIKNCGACTLAPSFQCAKTESNNQVNYGNYYCKDLRCNDEKGKERQNGESWCVFDSYSGEGKDPAGSEHWLASCSNGEVITDICGNYRSGICQEREITDGEKKFSTATCVVNEALKCIDYNSGNINQCGENSQCILKSIDVSSKFKFNFCSPQYPRGFNLKSTSADSSDMLCSIANTECKVVYVKTLSGWKCKENCECETSKFSEKMNDLCVSLGDCGSYINYIGEGTDNINVNGAPGISWQNYKQYSKPQEKIIQQINLGEGTQTIVNPFNSAEGGINLGSAISGLGAIGAAITIASFFAAPEPANAPSAQEVGQQAGGFFLGKLLPESVKEILAKQIFDGYSLTYSQFGAAIGGASIGMLAGKFIANALGIQGSAATAITFAGGVAGAAIGYHLAGGETILGIGTLTFAYVAIAIIVIIAALGLGKTKIKTVSFTCMPWQAPSGGDSCDKCNNDPSKPCTKYKCESLGQACVLINENTEKPTCQSVQRESIPPSISPLNVNLENYLFKNENQNSVEISGGTNSCIQEFTPLTFTLKTDEYSQCKWDLAPTADYESMSGITGEGTHYSLNHTFGIEGLSIGLLEANDVNGNIIDGFKGNLKLYVKCKDYFGNFNLNDYVVNFCINSGLDVTPVIPSLMHTNPLNGSKLKYGTSETNFTMWTNEPAECKYDKLAGKDYESMQNTMNCSTDLSEKETFGWKCSTTLNDLTNENNFYIKCKDQPWKEENSSDRNVNQQDYLYKIYVSKNNLQINSTYVNYNKIKTILNQNSPKEILGGASLFPIELGIETSNGADNGVAICYYQWNNDLIPFLNTNTNKHTQKFNLLNGNYNIPVVCRDKSQNEADANALFTLNIDTSSPKVTRVYKDAGKLKIITNEQAKCYVSFDESKSCSFAIEDAQDMEIGFVKDHSIQWDSKKIYYIKCKDLFDNANSGCAIKIIPSYFG